MATVLAEAGADIIGVAAHLLGEGSDIEKTVTSIGRKFTAYKCDFSNRDDLYSFIKDDKKKNCKIDILVNNAGTILRRPAAEHPDEFWDEVIAVNLNAQFILTREFGKEMVERGRGKIIFTASLLTFQGGITVPGYAASKGGIGQLTMAFANEWAGKGVNVNAIAPGMVDTDMWDLIDEQTASLRGMERGEPLRRRVRRIPIGRAAVPNDIANVALFLASNASDYMTGQTLNVDGGSVMS